MWGVYKLHNQKIGGEFIRYNQKIGGEFIRYNSGSEFVVANTSKWENFEPNEINFSHSFSQKEVSPSCLVFNSLPARGYLLSANNLCKKFVRPDLDPNCLTP